jgi:hypothetical protein
MKNLFAFHQKPVLRLINSSSTDLDLVEGANKVGLSG